MTSLARASLVVAVLVSLVACSTPRSRERRVAETYLPAVIGPRAKADGKARKLQVRVWAEEDFQRLTLDWQVRFYHQVERVNEVLRAVLGVELELVQVKTWPKQGRLDNLDAALFDLDAPRSGRRRRSGDRADHTAAGGHRRAPRARSRPAARQAPGAPRDRRRGGGHRVRAGVRAAPGGGARSSLRSATAPQGGGPPPARARASLGRAPRGDSHRADAAGVRLPRVGLLAGRHRDDEDRPQGAGLAREAGDDRVPREVDVRPLDRRREGPHARPAHRRSKAAREGDRRRRRGVEHGRRACRGGGERPGPGRARAGATRG